MGGQHCEVVYDTLRQIGADGVPALLLLNKCDRPEAQAALPALRQAFPEAEPISALEQDSVRRIKELIAARLPRR